MKKTLIKHIIFALFPYVLTGCFPEDKKVIPLDLDINEIPYSMYDTQTWFRLSDRTVVSHNAFTGWDLGFESTGDGHHIILNTSRFMHAGKTGSHDFEAVTSNICDTMVYDDSSGDLSMTAIGDWADFTDPANPVYTGMVYIIDLGTDNNGHPYGLKKVMFNSYEDNVYSFRFSNLDGTDDHTFDLEADPSRSFTMFSFSDGGQTVSVQPPDSDWDLCFTQYSTILYDDRNVATPYLVRGVYSNMDGTLAARDTVNSFDAITYANIGDYTYSDAQDAIGYEWKDFNDDTYRINPDIFYIIRDKSGEYYKLRFTGFYGPTGEKGYASFVLVRLTE